jgi:hypothetical protein
VGGVQRKEKFGSKHLQGKMPAITHQPEYRLMTDGRQLLYPAILVNKTGQGV